VGGCAPSLLNFLLLRTQRLEEHVREKRRPRGEGERKRAIAPTGTTTSTWHCSPAPKNHQKKKRKGEKRIPRDRGSELFAVPAFSPRIGKKEKGREDTDPIFPSIVFKKKSNPNGKKNPKKKGKGEAGAADCYGLTFPGLLALVLLARAGGEKKSRGKRERGGGQEGSGTFHLSVDMILSCRSKDDKGGTS